MVSWHNSNLCNAYNMYNEMSSSLHIMKIAFQGMHMTIKILCRNKAVLQGSNVVPYSAVFGDTWL